VLATVALTRGPLAQLDKRIEPWRVCPQGAQSSCGAGV
jgi:hypothetical protein